MLNDVRAARQIAVVVFIEDLVRLERDVLLDDLLRKGVATFGFGELIRLTSRALLDGDEP